MPTDATGAEQASTDPDPPHWLDAALHQPLPPEPADGVLDLLAPLLDGPLLTVDRPAAPTVVELVALHRVEIEADYVDPPVIGAGDEPAIPARFAAGLSVLPHIDFPT